MLASSVHVEPSLRAVLWGEQQRLAWRARFKGTPYPVSEGTTSWVVTSRACGAPTSGVG